MSVVSPTIDYLDLASKRIYLLAGIREYHPVDDIYKEIRNIRRLDETMRVFNMPVIAEGAVPKGGGKFTPRYAVFNDGWQIRPEDVEQTLNIVGEQITDDGQSGPACIDTTELVSSIIIQYTPPAAEIIRDEESLAAIENMSFNNGVSLDVINGSAGTAYPVGNEEHPSDNLTDAITIANSRGFKKLYLRESMTGANALNGLFSGFTIIGQSPVNTDIEIDDIANCEKVTIKQCNIVAGDLDGGTHITECYVGNINYMDGQIDHCGLYGNILLSGNKDAVISNSYIIDQDSPLTIDMGGTGQSLAMPKFTGIVSFSNLSDPESEIGVGINGGKVTFEDTITAGNHLVGGDGLCDDFSTGPAEVNIDGLSNKNTIALAVWANTEHSHPVGSHGEMLHRLKYLERKVYVDTEALSDGDGSQGSPFRLQNDAADFAEEQGITTLVVLADITLDRQFKGFKFEGTGFPTIDCNDQTINKSEFFHCQMEGTYVGKILVKESILLDNFYLHGVFENCGTMSSLICIDGSDILMKDCSNAHAGLYHTVISMNSGGSANLSMHNCDGRFDIADCDHVDDVVSCSLGAGHLVFTETCVAGNMIALGTCEFEDNTTGANVINRTNAPKTITKEVMSYDGSY